MSSPWTFTARRMYPGVFTVGLSFARYRGDHLLRRGWGCCFNLGWWYVDLNYRKRNE